MEMRLIPHEVPGSIPPGSSSSDWRDSRSASTFQTSATIMQVPESHYNYADPSPSTFASPTDSSPSASPQHPERRRHSATIPLFLAQHTSATPITIEPLDANNPGWSASSSENLYSPPSRYTFVARAGHHVTSMDFTSSPAPNYTFPTQHDAGHFGGAAVGMHRRRLSMLGASRFQVQAPHLYDARNSTYGMMIDEREQYHETADIGQESAQEREDWPRHGHQLYSHYEATPLDSRPVQPQLLLATTMPTNTPIVIDEPSLVHANRQVYHHYDGPSQADLSTPTHTFPTTAFRSNPNPPCFSAPFIHRAPEPTQVYAYAPEPHSDMQNRYRTNMDTYPEANYGEGSPTLTARHTAPHPAQPPCLQDDEPMMVSPTQRQGQGESSHKPIGDVMMHGAVVSPGQGAVDPECAEGPSDQREHYVPIESYEVAEDLQKNAPTAPISDRPESQIGMNVALGVSSHLAVEAVEETERDGEDDPQRMPTASEKIFDIKQSPYSSVVDLSSNPISGSVAVAPLQQFTAPEYKQDERFRRGDHDNRGNGEGAEGSTNVVNRTGAIKTTEADEGRKPSQTISEPATASGVHPTRSNSNPLSLQTSSVQESAANIADMQVISPSSYSHSQDPQGYNIPSVYPFPSPYSKPTFNQHLPTIPSLLRPEWRRSANSEYSTSYHQQGGDTHVTHFPRKHSFDCEDTLHGRPLPSLHRNSLPDLALAAEQRSSQETASAHPSPSQVPGYYTPGERLVPAAFGNPSSSQGSGSSASSTPPTVLHDASANPVPMYRYEPAAPSASSQMPHSSEAAAYDSPRDQKVRYEPAYPAVFNPTAVGSPHGSRGQDGVYYGSYPPEFGRAAPAHPRYLGHYGRGSSSSPAPPMIAGNKRGREEDWGAEDREIGRELQRRRSSYSQSAAMMIGGLAYRSDSVSVSPSLPSAEMGVIRVAGYAPSLQEMGVRDVTGEPLNAGVERYANGRRPGEDAIRSGSDTSYSFIALPGNTVRKRPRRKFEEITRNYVCIWPGCSKAYGTLNHLNAHVTMQKHGAKRVPSEFKELRKVWRKQKREQQHQVQHVHGHGSQNDGGSEFYPDEDRENAAEDDEGSVYNPAVELAQ